MSEDNNLTTKKYKAIIEEEVSKAIKESGVKDLNFTWSGKYSIYISAGLIMVSIFGMGYLLVMIKSVVESVLMKVLLIIGCLLLAAVLILAILWMKKILRKKKNAKALLAKLDIEKIYKKSFNELFYPNFEYIEIAPKFMVKPYESPIGDVLINNVINFKDNNDNIFSIGTITEKVVRHSTDSKGNKTTYYEYYCYRILSAKIKKNFTMNTKISRKRFLSSDNAVLESQEFEKKYATVTDNQIEVRKLLVPKVIVNLNELADKYNKNIPRMHFIANHVSFIFPAEQVSGFEDTEHTFQAIYFEGNNQVVEEVTEKVEYDFNYIKEIYTWFKAYDLLS